MSARKVLPWENSCLSDTPLKQTDALSAKQLGPENSELVNRSMASPIFA
jgi:hypothetical protein